MRTKPYSHQPAKKQTTATTPLHATFATPKNLYASPHYAPQKDGGEFIADTVTGNAKLLFGCATAKFHGTGAHNTGASRNIPPPLPAAHYPVQRT